VQTNVSAHSREAPSVAIRAAIRDPQRPLVFALAVLIHVGLFQLPAETQARIRLGPLARASYRAVGERRFAGLDQRPMRHRFIYSLDVLRGWDTVTHLTTQRIQREQEKTGK
jgi:hypothetical protein